MKMTPPPNICSEQKMMMSVKQFFFLQTITFTLRQRMPRLNHGEILPKEIQAIESDPL